MPTTDIMLCPCCKGILYKQSTPVAKKADIRRRAGPPIQVDAEGYYMKCPHCSKRVAVKMISPVPRSGRGFKLDETQACDRILP